MRIIVEGEEYAITANKVSSPALKVKEIDTDIIIGYGFISSTKPETPTLKVGEGLYLNQPKIPFTITLAISLFEDNSAYDYSEYLSQTNVYSADWIFVGQARVEDDWRADSGNDGHVSSLEGKFYSLGDTYENNDNWHTVTSEGTLKEDSMNLADVTQRITLRSVDDCSYYTGGGDNRERIQRSGDTWLQGTLTITGYKLP